MDTVRDLGRIEPWQESLERSRARRSTSKRPPVQRQERRPERERTRKASPRRPERDLARRASPRRTATNRYRAGRPKPNGTRIAFVSAGGVFTVAALLVVLAHAVTGRSGRASLTAARAHAVSPRAHPSSDGAGPISQSVASRTAGLIPGCHAASRASHYVNPLARARVKPERIDQGVDYAGSGTLTAIGAAKVTYVATSGTGWPGSFIEYRLLDGTYAGCYVYYAEGVTPTAGLRVGQTVAAGQPIAGIIPGWETGIELGWGAGISTVTYAAKTHEWNATSDESSKASAAGKSFSALIASLGGPPGKVEG